MIVSPIAYETSNGTLFLSLLCFINLVDARFVCAQCVMHVCELFVNHCGVRICYGNVTMSIFWLRL